MRWDLEGGGSGLFQGSVILLVILSKTAHASLYSR
jgi:hypothetical protein